MLTTEELLELLQTSKSTIKAKDISPFMSDPTEEFKYQKLTNPLINFIFENSNSLVLKNINGIQVSINSFQAKSSVCPNEDRFSVNTFDFGHGEWLAAFVCDGHLGSKISEDAITRIPVSLKASLNTLFNNTPNPSNDLIADALSTTITSYDSFIGQELLDIFPMDKMKSGEMTDKDLDELCESEQIRKKIRKVCEGSTIVVALVDDKRENVWIANAGDTEAILGEKLKVDEDWKIESLAKLHNGFYKEAADELRGAHPGEEEAVLNGRVLGLIMVTKALGDFHFKLPKIYADKLFFHERSKVGFPERYPKGFVRCLSPPYLTSKPNIVHRQLQRLEQGEKRFLVLSTDGLRDAMSDLIKKKVDEEDGESQDQNESTEEKKEEKKDDSLDMDVDIDLDREIDRLIINLAGHQSVSSSSSDFTITNPSNDQRFSNPGNKWIQKLTFEDHVNNLATSLIRNAFGGKGEEVSWKLTLEAPFKIADDVTVVVLEF